LEDPDHAFIDFDSRFVLFLGFRFVQISIDETPVGQKALDRERKL
jgi:hypothetical protein